MMAGTRAPALGYRGWFLLLMLAVAAMFWRHLFTGDVLFYRDITAAHFPRAVELRAIVRGGELPLWNPYEHFGEPVAANPNYLLFYPTAWLPWLLPVAYGFKLHFAIHFFAAAAGSFLLARRARLGPLACFAAGAVFVFSGPVVSLGNFFNMLPAAAWMPFVLLACDTAVRSDRRHGPALLGGALTMQLLAGEPFTSLATLMLCLAWALAFRVNSLARTASRLLWSMVWLAGFSAIQWVPAALHAMNTARAAELTFAHSFTWSLHPLRLLEMVFPDFWGDPLAYGQVPWVYLDGRERLLLTLYIGVLPLSLAAVAAFAWRDRATKFWVVAGAAAFVLALGSFTPLSYLFYYVLPLFRVVRYPVKFLLPAALALAQLTAMGVEHLRSEQPADARPPRMLAWLAAALAAAWLALSAFFLIGGDFARSVAVAMSGAVFHDALLAQLKPWLPASRAETVQQAAQWLQRAVPAVLQYVLGAAVLLSAVLSPRVSPRIRRLVVNFTVIGGVLALALANHRFNPLVSPAFFQRPPVVEQLKTERPPVRVFAEPYGVAQQQPGGGIRFYRPAVSFLPPAAWESFTELLSLQMGAGIFHLEAGYTGDIESILLRDQNTLHVLVSMHRIAGDKLLSMLRMASIEYALYRRLPPQPGLEWLGTAPNATDIPVQLFRVADPLPRAYISCNGEQRGLGRATLLALLDDNFDPATKVIIGGPSSDTTASPGTGSGTARVISRSALRVEVEADSPAWCYLVLTDSYNSGWRVFVDGAPAHLLRANQIFRAVQLQGGRSRVEFIYRPASLYVGAWVTLAALVLLAGSAILGLWRTRRP